MINATATFRPRSTSGQFIAAVINPAVAASVLAAAQMIQQSAQAKCPVDTGALRDSIAIKNIEGASTIGARVAPGMFYAEYVEYGTGRKGDPSAPYEHVQSWPGMKPQPYMRPAYDESIGPIQDLFRSQLATALR